MRINLKVKAGPHEGKVFEFEERDNFIVGRSPRAHFRLPIKDKCISRIHFLIEMNPPHCRLIDMGSTNGTTVNGRKVVRADLKDGDLITAGQTVLQLTVAATDPSGPPDERPASPRPVPRPAPTGIPAGHPDTTLDRPARPGPTGPAPGVCRVCRAPLPVMSADPADDRTTPETLTLCPACRARVGEQAQPVPGYRIVREPGRG